MQYDYDNNNNYENEYDYDNNNKQETEDDYNNINKYESEYGYSDDNEIHNTNWTVKNVFLPTTDQFCSPKYGGKQPSNYWHLVDCPRLELDQGLKTETIAYYTNDTFQNRDRCCTDAHNYW